MANALPIEDVLVRFKNFAHDCDYKDNFADYDVPFGRDDCPGYALVLAEMIIKINDCLDLPF